MVSDIALLVFVFNGDITSFGQLQFTGCVFVNSDRHVCDRRIFICIRNINFNLCGTIQPTIICTFNIDRIRTFTTFKINGGCIVHSQAMVRTVQSKSIVIIARCNFTGMIIVCVWIFNCQCSKNFLFCKIFTDRKIHV